MDVDGHMDGYPVSSRDNNDILLFSKGCYIGIRFSGKFKLQIASYSSINAVVIK
jgi:hypothetical protein